MTAADHLAFASRFASALDRCDFAEAAEHLRLNEAGKMSRIVHEELPADINILSVDVATHRFHARHSAESRSYLYQIARRRTAFGKALVWWVRESLDVGRMREAATLGSRVARMLLEQGAGLVLEEVRRAQAPTDGIEP